MLWRTRVNAGPAEPRVITALEFRRAAVMPDYSGWWVYCLGRAGLPVSTPGFIWYAGQSESLLRRLDDHRRAYPQLYGWDRVYLVSVRDEYQACLVELEMIDFYQPEYNTMGRADELRRRLASYQAGQRRHSGQGRRRGAIDSSQASA